MPYFYYETTNLKLKRVWAKKKLLWAFQQLVPGKEAPFCRPKPRPRVTTTMATVTPAKMRSLFELTKLSPNPIIVNCDLALHSKLNTYKIQNFQ